MSEHPSEASRDRVVCAKVDDELATRLEQLAAASERTLSGEIRLALREHLARQPEPDHLKEVAAA